MKKQQKRDHIKALVDFYGADILDSPRFFQTNQYMQHGSTTTYEHTISAACVCLWLARKLHIRCDEQSLVRGALLHDYFLYDWHSPRRTHPPKHATRHGSYALKNASEDFSINPLEAEMIREHMWPCTLKPPRHREAYVLILADKICSLKETFSTPCYKTIVEELNYESR